VEIVDADRWTTDMTPEMFVRVTGMEQYPEYLQKDVEEDILKVYSNGEINYKLRDIHAKVSVIWNYEAPEGAGDTHYSIMRGTKCNLIIQQGEAEGYQPKLYIESAMGEGLEAFAEQLENAINQNLQERYPGIKLQKLADDRWAVDIPGKYKVGHEAHFGQVTEKYLRCLVEGQLPEWEVPNMITKYYTTTQGMKEAMK